MSRTEGGWFCSFMGDGDGDSSALQGQREQLAALGQRGLPIGPGYYPELVGDDELKDNETGPVLTLGKVMLK